jgi:hypothetical protein
MTTSDRYFAQNKIGARFGDVVRWLADHGMSVMGAASPITA